MTHTIPPFDLSTLPTDKPLTIGIVAGEVSGDALGADFMAKMNAIYPSIRWVGVGGELMTKAGLDSLIDMTRLSVMGIGEVVKHLPDLLLAKKEILDEFLSIGIDIFVGIDAPDFNLRLAKSLKQKSVIKPIFCVQYVSPSVWAWREGRIFGIKSATDLVLCLFPFETAVYDKHGHPAVCVGHPLLDKIQTDERSGREIYDEFLSDYSPLFPELARLQHSPARPICVMAGSRTSEINAILPLLIGAMDKLDKAGDHAFILPVVGHEHAHLVKSLIKEQAGHLLDKCHIIFTQTAKNVADNIHHAKDDQAGRLPTTLSLSQNVMNACELTILASGTATLEALLLHRPMVVVYKVNVLTYTIAKRLVKIPYVSLPNILAYNQTGQAVVPELIQDDANANNIARHALDALANPSEQIAKLTRTTTRLRADSHHDVAVSVLMHFFNQKNVL
ncbi:Lipid-A-disaccharide synthase [Moraxella equi]|uniref:Lipid-A-disaccharide synthase n=1 Tax=Moraxella equi TaxID=60442 RepID=A0A378QV50_9GAMM|nr:hypothetical protein [Moraxella equi]OPH39410.1 hypothetical protein B5J93_03870 [Moraxella equi]STZ03313.1 Lipid-A-disaccharide synthase [Moraxella equi]